MLWGAAIGGGYRSPSWLTFKQALVCSGVEQGPPNGMIGAIKGRLHSDGLGMPLACSQAVKIGMLIVETVFESGVSTPRARRSKRSLGT
jgi:hypothetical protein